MAGDSTYLKALVESSRILPLFVTGLRESMVVKLVIDKYTGVDTDINVFEYIREYLWEEGTGIGHDVGRGKAHQIEWNRRQLLT